jgi:hypothetical protein
MGVGKHLGGKLMSDKTQLVDAITEALYPHSAYDLPDICISVGLEGPIQGEDPAMFSKRKYVKRRILKMGVDELFAVAEKIVADYGNPDLEVTLQSLRGGQAGPVEQLIFASIGGTKPDIIYDLISNKVKIVNAHQSLIYNQPIVYSKGLLWKEIEDWWQKKNFYTPLRDRLFASLQSDREELFFNTYYDTFLPLLGNDLPALVPQVYFHYDPKTIKQLGGTRRITQRMDFLMFLPHKRLIFEIDGLHHYSQKNQLGDDIAKPHLYAQMVAEDRQYRLAGYEVYRFGGYEIYSNKGVRITKDFFRQLFTDLKIL